MITFEELLAEVNEKESMLEEGLRFYQYKAVVLFKYSREDKSLNMGSEKLAEIARAIAGCTRVSTASLDKAKGIAIMNVNLVSQKPAKEAYIAFKKNILSKFKGIVLDVKVGAGTIETKHFVR